MQAVHSAGLLTVIMLRECNATPLPNHDDSKSLLTGFLQYHLEPYSHVMQVAKKEYIDVFCMYVCMYVRICAYIFIYVCM